MATPELRHAPTEQADYHNPTKYNRWLYPFYDNWTAARKMGNHVTQLSINMGNTVLDAWNMMGAPEVFTKNQRDYGRALSIMSEWLAGDFGKPEFGIHNTEINGETVAVTEEIVEGYDHAFGSLLHFKRHTERDDPPVLIAAPMSGHYATLLRETVRQMLPNHDVYITDWKNAANVPESEGKFKMDTYIDYLNEFIKELGPDVNIVAVCQSTVPVMAAVSHLAEHDPATQPNTMTLMGGPLDTEAAPTAVTEFAQKHDIGWFRENLIAKAHNGREVYMGMQQLFSFMSMNVPNHQKKLREIFNHLVKGEMDKAKAGMDFYSEYFSVCDMDAAFYEDTVDFQFIQNQMAKGIFKYRGKKIKPSKISRTAVFTVEGANDDIAAPGQTYAVHDWLTGLDESKRFHHLQEGIGHYGLFSGSKWSNEINPRITAFIREAATRNGRNYDVAA